MPSALKALALALAMLPVSAGAEEVRGVPRVVDGDTLAIDGTRYRLRDIDAPERDQPYGPKSAAALSALIGGREVVCRWDERDRYDRPLAACYPVLESGRVSALSLNLQLVRAGHAAAGLPYGYRLERVQSGAMRACKGMWAAAGLAWCHRWGRAE